MKQRENTGMTEAIELTAGQKRFREAVAKFALPGEKWLTNGRARPYHRGQSFEETAEELKSLFPKYDLRFETDNIVDGEGEVLTNDEFNKKYHDDERQINFAVYGKPKPPMP